MCIKIDSHYFEDDIDNIRYDEESLYQQDKKNGFSLLRFWECKDYIVVLGRSNDAHKEVHINKCYDDNIAIIKRCSGGGTVLQGTGSLNYSFILNQTLHPDLTQISSSNTWVMQHIKTALSPLHSQLCIRGITDLCIGQKKCSGNAQRRLRHAILFHGTLLYNFDLSKIAYYLKHPPKEPHYRERRSHNDFLCNLNIDKTTLIQHMTDYFQNICFE